MMVLGVAALAVSELKYLNIRWNNENSIFHLLIYFNIYNVEEPAAGLFEGDLFADAPLPQSSMPIEHGSDDDMDAGGWDMGGHSTASR